MASKDSGSTFPSKYSSQAKCPPTGGATPSPANRAPTAAQKAEATGKRMK